MKPVSMQDLAKACGVSKNTVSQALRNSPQISEGMRRTIAETAKRMGYQKNAVVAELMIRLHAGGSRRFQCTLALINANRDKMAFKRHPTIPLYVQGCRERATELGYKLDEFWIHEPDLSGERLCQIFRGRGIPGGILVGLMDENRLPESFQPVAREFPVVVTGVRTREPRLSFACVDHHMVALRAFEKVVELGYKRPGLVLDAKIDALVEHRFSAGYEVGQRRLLGVGCGFSGGDGRRPVGRVHLARPLRPARKLRVRLADLVHGLLLNRAAIVKSCSPFLPSCAARASRPAT
jgi:LacI family transcriptional regulator